MTKYLSGSSDVSTTPILASRLWTVKIVTVIEFHNEVNDDEDGQ